MDELNPTVSGGEQEVVDLQETPAEEVKDEGQGAEPGAGDAGRQDQRAINAAIAAARRRAERDTEERTRRQVDDDIAAMRIPNPAKPGTYFSSKKDLEDYSGALRAADAERRARAQGRTAADVLEEDADREFVRKQRAAAQKVEEATKRKAERDRFIEADVRDFQARYPDVDIKAVDVNQAFRRFAGSRYGKEPLADLWGDYCALVNDTAAQQRATQADRRARSTGAGNGGGNVSLTAAQREALREWNAEHPEMRMTEREFAEM